MHMVRSARELQGFMLNAKDGYLGKTAEFHFDEETWTVRYLAAHAGGEFLQRCVLVSPVAVRRINDVDRTIEIDLSLEQVNGGPGIEWGAGITRRHELSYYRYYGWPAYWRGGERWGFRQYPTDRVTMEMIAACRAPQKREPEERALRTFRGAASCQVRTADGGSFRIEDFLVDDETWAVRYLVAVVEHEQGLRRALVAPHWMREINWQDNWMTIGVPLELVALAPAYDASTVIGSDYELRLLRHYGRDGEPAAVPEPVPAPAAARREGK